MENIVDVFKLQEAFRCREGVSAEQIKEAENKFDNIKIDKYIIYSFAKPNVSLI